MKLYSIWWEEEILLMCSCNDCSKRGGKWKGATDGCLHLNSLKEIKALKARFSAFCCHPALGNAFQLLWTESAANWESPAAFTSVKVLWHQEAGGCRGPLIQWMANVLPTRVWSAVECEAQRRQKRSSRTCLSHSSPVNKTWKQDVYWPCSFPREEQRRTDVTCNQIPKLTLAAAARSLYDEDVSVLNKPVSQHEQS